MSKKQTNDEPIVFDQALGKSEAFVLKYRNIILAAIAIIVVAIAGSVIYNTYIAEPREAEAAEAIFQAENLFAANSFEEALNGDSAGTMGFIQIADEYSGTKTADLAEAYAGISLAKLGRYEEAITYLKKFDGDDKIVAPSVLRTLGDCYAHTGDNDAAVKYLIKAANAADNNSISPYCLFNAAKICEQQADKSKALDLYTQIKEKYPTSYQAMDIEKHIENVK